MSISADGLHDALFSLTAAVRHVTEALDAIEHSDSERVAQAKHAISVQVAITAQKLQSMV